MVNFTVLIRVTKRLSMLTVQRSKSHGSIFEIVVDPTSAHPLHSGSETILVGAFNLQLLRESRCYGILSAATIVFQFVHRTEDTAHAN